MTWWLPAGFSWNCHNIHIQPTSLKLFNIGGGALSLISLPIERAPPLSNTLHTKSLNNFVSLLVLFC